MSADPQQRPPTAAEARAEVEARRAEVRAERAERFRRIYGDRPPGRWIVRASWASTVLLAAATTAAAVDPSAWTAPFLVVALVWFLAGSALLAVDVVLAAARSRSDAMGIGGLFFLAGSAPPAVQRPLLGSLAVQVVVSVTGAAVRPFTELAFGTLAPVLALGWCGLWAVRHGTFPPRGAQPERPAPEGPGHGGSGRGGRGGAGGAAGAQGARAGTAGEVPGG